MSISVLIADDNLELATLVSSYITKDKAIKVVNIANDGDSAIDSYFSYAPDVMILDLKMPNKNGIQVLDTLCTQNGIDSQKCNIIVTSGNLADFKFRYTSKVFRVFEKPFDLPALLDCIHDIYKVTNKKPSCRELCENAVLQLGFNFTNIGTTYIIDTVEYLYENNINTFSIKKIYEDIARKNNTTVRNAKWNIEKAIKSMYRYSKMEDIKKWYPYYDGKKPPPKYVITLALYKAKAQKIL